jgi:hypothetical protein
MEMALLIATTIAPSSQILQGSAACAFLLKQIMMAMVSRTALTSVRRILRKSLQELAAAVRLKTTQMVMDSKIA